MKISTKQIEIEAYVNSWVIKSLHLPSCSKRDYQLSGAGLVFKIDDNLSAVFKHPLNQIKLKMLIQKEFKGHAHGLDTCAIGYLKIGSLPIVWQIKTVCKETGELVKAKHFNHRSINFVVTAYRATCFAKLES